MISKVFNRFRSALERRWKLLLMILLLLQVVISIAVFIAYDGFVLGGDSESYTSPAVSLIHSGKFIDEKGHSMLFRTPGYPVFLAVIYFLGGSNTAVAVVQLVMALSASLLVFSTIRTITKTHWAGILAVLFYTLDFIHYYHSVNVGVDILFAYLLLLTAFFLAKWMTGGHRRLWFVLSVVALQAAGLTKPTLLYYMFLIAALLIVLTILKKIDWKSLTAYLVIFSVCFFGWCTRNYYQSGYFIPSNILYIQGYEFDVPDMMVQSDHISFDEARSKTAGLFKQKHGDISALPMMKQYELRRTFAAEYITAHPVEYVKLNLTGVFLLMLGPGQAPLGDIIHNGTALLLMSLFNSGILVLLYLIYAVSFLARLRRVTWFEWLLFLTSCYLIAAAASVGYQRYRIAFYPLVLIGAMLALVRVTHKKEAPPPPDAE